MMSVNRSKIARMWLETYAEWPCLIARGRHDAARPIAAHRDGLSPQIRIVALFDRRKESIHVDMDDLPVTR